jgi:hypothetical protein
MAITALLLVLLALIAALVVRTLARGLITLWMR